MNDDDKWMGMNNSEWKGLIFITLFVIVLASA
jgi:hypothetical protein